MQTHEIRRLEIDAEKENLVVKQPNHLVAGKIVFKQYNLVRTLVNLVGPKFIANIYYFDTN